MAGSTDPNVWSGEFKTTDPNVVYQIGVRELYQDKNQNFTRLRIVVSIKSNGTSPVPINGSLNIMLDDTTYIMMYDGSKTVEAYWQYVYDYSFEIPHKPDGTKTLSIRANWMTSFFASAGILWNYTLTKINRVSTFTCPESGIMGNPIPIVITKEVQALRHKLTYSFGGTTGTIGTDVDVSVSWTPPTSLANKIPNALSGTATITCATYDGTNLVGSVSRTIKLYVPTYYPSIDSITLTDPTGYLSTFGGYVRTKSKIKVQVASSSSYGATIKTTQIRVAGITSTQNPFTTNELMVDAGSNTVYVKVTDSRGRVSEGSSAYTVLSYVQPTITKLTSSRCNASGVLDDGGDHMKIEYTCSIDPVGNKNTKRILLQHKKEADSTWTTDVNVQEYSRNTSVVVVADINSSYDVKLIVSDYFSSNTRNVKVPTAFTLMDFRSTGHGMAFGKVSEEDIIDVNMIVKMHHGIYGQSVVNPNLNDLTTVGKYIIQSNANASDSQNIPVKKAGSIYVICPNSHNVKDLSGAWTYVLQIYMTYEGEFYFRRIYSDGSKVIHYESWKYIRTYETTYKPYYEKGDVININYFGAGFVTGSARQVYITLPLDKPILGNPTITIAPRCVFRQNNAYGYGSSASSYTTPSSVEQISHSGTGLKFVMNFDNSTNVTNNSPIAIQMVGTITFS